MKVNTCIGCNNFPCLDINTNCYVVPDKEIDPGKIKIFMISEAPPPDKNDYFYAPAKSFYMQTTLQAFHDAGFNYSAIGDIINSGIYITTAIKCGKTGYSVSATTIDNCSKILEQEIDLFPNIKVFLLMGDVAIKAMNYIAKRNSGKRVIPGGSTYKIRKEKYYYNDLRVFPSYLQTGKNYLIEKSKRRMIAEDIKEALEIINTSK